MDAARDLLQHHTNPNTPALGASGSVLGAAIQQGSAPIAQALLEAGADANAHGGAANLLVSAFARPDLLRLLVAHGADVNARNAGGQPTPYHEAFTPLMTAIQEGNREVVQFLLAHGASPAKGCTPIDLREPFLTPLRIARQQKRQDIVLLLQQAGAKE